jgi:hypothetical protein
MLMDYKISSMMHGMIHFCVCITYSFLMRSSPQHTHDYPTRPRDRFGKGLTGGAATCVSRQWQPDLDDGRIVTVIAFRLFVHDIVLFALYGSFWHDIWHISNCVQLDILYSRIQCMFDRSSCMV